MSPRKSGKTTIYKEMLEKMIPMALELHQHLIKIEPSGKGIRHVCHICRMEGNVSLSISKCTGYPKKEKR